MESVHDDEAGRVLDETKGGEGTETHHQTGQHEQQEQSSTREQALHASGGRDGHAQLPLGHAKPAGERGDHRSTWHVAPNFWSEFELALAKVWSGHRLPF